MHESLEGIGDEKELPKDWAESDSAYVRVVEDLIEVLIR